MGGGKTHLLVGLRPAREASLHFEQSTAPVCSHADAFETAAIAAFNGRNNPDHFFWGEIANQLGKGDQFRSFLDGRAEGAGREGLAEALRGRRARS